MIVDDLIQQPGSWLSEINSSGVVISSRIRLARNVEPVAFPGWAGEQERTKLFKRLRTIFSELKSMPDAQVLEMCDLAANERDILRERHLISQELVDRGPGSGLAMCTAENIAVMINEEDHLRLQAIAPGLQLADIWTRLNAVDTELEEHLTFAYSEQLGYLTACPSNVGTGLRASVMMHLAGLRLTSEVEPVINGLEKIGFTVRGLWGEGTDAHGNMFQVSNQNTLGNSEENIINEFITIVSEVTEHELNARARLAETRYHRLVDWVARARGILQNARMISSQEAADLLSALRLGFEMGIIGGLSLSTINEIMISMQPGHLQKAMQKAAGPEERDRLRADLARERVRDVVFLD